MITSIYYLIVYYIVTQLLFSLQFCCSASSNISNGCWSVFPFCGVIIQVVFRTSIKLSFILHKDHLRDQGHHIVIIVHGVYPQPTRGQALV